MIDELRWRSGWQVWQAIPEAALHVYCAGETGPTALVTAGVHGDEYEGPAAIAELAAELLREEPGTFAGRVLLAPVVNPLAWTAATRVTPSDGANLARTFPGVPDGSMTQRLAFAVFERLVRKCDFLIDLHSGGVEYLFTPVAGFYGEIKLTNPSYAAAVQFGLPRLWQLPSTPGVLSYEATALNKVAIGHEYLGAGQLSTDGVAAYRLGIRRCLSGWGILRQQEGSTPREDVKPSNPVYTGDWLVSSTTGLFRAHVALNETVAEGQLLGTIHNEWGRLLEEMHASFAGTVLGLRSKAFIHGGAWTVLVGRAHGTN